MPTLRLGDTAPDFEQDSSFGRIRFHDWLGDGWGVLIAPPGDEPLDATVDPEQGAWLRDALARRGAKLIGLAPQADAGTPFPVVADRDHALGSLFRLAPADYRVVDAEPSVFIIDPAKTLRATISSPPEAAGRSAASMLRVFDSLQA